MNNSGYSCLNLGMVEAVQVNGDAKKFSTVLYLLSRSQGTVFTLWSVSQSVNVSEQASEFNFPSVYV